ncbi:SDR family oxidoreductase [Pseudomonas sp. RIT-To-2]|uniref:SDR family oxidoreductase n=1 Tax=Pseudomonas sp. RIT-To-2 TaxID=3462541 RepID=UPI00241334CB
MQMQNLSGKIAVVTGASSGIGAAAARLLVDEGVTVVLAARRKDRIQALADELGELALAVEADVADPQSVAALFKLVHDQFGGLDLLFNNAGVGINGVFADSSPEGWRTQIDANFYGVLNCTHAAIPLMQGREGAMISTVSSVGGRNGAPGWAVYCATKFAVIGFHDSLRKELGDQGIRVSLIEPGATWTEWGGTGENDPAAQHRAQVDALHSVDIAQGLVYSFAQPPRVLVGELVIRPVRQMD